MKLILKTEHRDTSGKLDTLVQTLEGESIVIGRGAAASIRLTSEAVAPAHAVIEQSGDGLLIQDLGTTVGTQVNGRRIQTASLKSGDIIRIASSDFEVLREGEHWGLKQSLPAGLAEDEDPQQIIGEMLQRFEVARQLPSFLALSLFVLAALSAVYLLYPVLSGKQAKWSSGPLAKVHAHLEHNCVACHSEPFAPVKDKDCQVCHAVSDHTPTLQKTAHHFALGNKRCAECHHDHNGPRGVLPRNSRLCSDCHARLDAVAPDSRLPDVVSWDEHPEFRLRRDGAGEGDSKVPLIEAQDLTPLKLNHAVHLKAGIRGPQGPTNLSCQDCHAFDGERRAPAPVTFEKNCRSCHSLEFDGRFSGEQVPHGDTGKVREFLFTKYSQLLLGPDQQQKFPELSRKKPGQQPSPEEYNRATLERVSAEVERTEGQLYTRTACQLCHEVSPSDSGDAVSYQIKKPNIPTVWFSDARFSHRPHLNVACIDCHKGVRESEHTSDVLLPAVAACQECHTEKPRENRITSDCTECHAYHAGNSLQSTDGGHP